MRLSVLMLVTAGLCVAAPSTAFGQAADPADVESIDAIVAAVYDVISGDAGEARDWDRWRSLFAEGATLSAVVASNDGYRRRITLLPFIYGSLNGYWLFSSVIHLDFSERIPAREPLSG